MSFDSVLKQNIKLLPETNTENDVKNSVESTSKSNIENCTEIQSEINTKINTKNRTEIQPETNTKINTKNRTEIQPETQPETIHEIIFSKYDIDNYIKNIFKDYYINHPVAFDIIKDTIEHYSDMDFLERFNIDMHTIISNTNSIYTANIQYIKSLYYSLIEEIKIE